jgi:hypothetical protein
MENAWLYTISQPKKGQSSILKQPYLIRFKGVEIYVDGSKYVITKGRHRLLIITEEGNYNSRNSKGCELLGVLPVPALLIESDMSAGSISDSLGFCNQFHFCKKFRAE